MRASLLERLRRAVRVLVETEDGEPPPRLREEADLELMRHPGAAPEEWAEFAADLAESAWRDAWRLGLERGAELRQNAPQKDPGRWSIWEGHPTTLEVLRRRGDPGDPLAGVPPEKAREFLEAMMQAHPVGGDGPAARVILLGGDGTPQRVRLRNEDDDGPGDDDGDDDE